MQAESRFSPLTSAAVQGHSINLSNDKEYLERRYRKVLGYHNEPGNTLDEIARYAQELDEISAQIRAIG